MNEGLEKSLGLLLEKQEIHEQMMRYCRAIDHHDDEVLRTIYWPDAYDDHGNFTGDVEGLIESNHTERPGWQTATSSHIIGNCLIEFLSDTVACVETYFQAAKQITINGMPHLWIRAGRYMDVFLKRGDEWRVIRRRVADDWNLQLPAAIPPIGTSPGKFSADDPWYEFKREAQLADYV